MSAAVNGDAVEAPAARGRMTAEPAGVVGAWLAGWRAALAMPGVVLVKWFVNVFFAGAATLPIALLLHEHMGHSAVAEEVFSRIGIDITMEFASAYRAQLRLAAAAAAPVALMFLLINLYLTGGILDRLQAGTRASWGRFFTACNRHVGALLRVGLLTLVLFAALVVLPHYALGWLVERLTEDAAGPAPVFYATWVHWTLVFLLASWVVRVYDYARIVLVLIPERNAWASVRSGAAFVWRNGFRTFLLWLLLTFIPLAVTFVVATVPAEGGLQTMIAMWLSVAVGQALIAFRITGSLATFGGQMRFMTSLGSP